MYEFDSNLIRVELGDDAFDVLSTKDNRSAIDKLKGKPAPAWNDDLTSETDTLWSKLKKEGFTLPAVHFSKASKLPPNIFRITFGVDYEDFDVNGHTYTVALEKKAREFCPENLTVEKVREELNTGISYVLQKNYQDAMSQLMKAYFLSSSKQDQTTKVVSLLNIAGIYLINNQLNEAYSASKQAQLLVEKDTFFDPYLKFYAHKAIANIEMSCGEFELAAGHFEQAFLDINSVGDVQLIIDALHNEAAAYMQVGSHKKCVQILARIVSCISQSAPRDDDRELLITLYEMRDLIAEYTEKELEQLKKAYYDMSKSLMHRAADTIITILSEYGPCYVSMCVGTLMSNDKYYINQHNVSGNNIIVRRGIL